MYDKRRAEILAQLARYTGRRVSWEFLKQTPKFIPDIDRFHNLITGIFKPQWSDYALSIVMQLKSPYERKDEVLFLEDGRWLMTYSPRSGGPQVADNRALMKCVADRVPLAVFKQLSDKTDRDHGATYLVVGLGVATEYDAVNDIVLLQSVDQPALEDVTRVIQDEAARYELQLYAHLTNEFRPFGKEETVTYTVSAQKRDSVFRTLVLREYDYRCSVCQLKFRLGSLIEAQAAHIVPKHRNGTDDPRNGLALCRTHHWAFDTGLFTIASDHTILLSPDVNHAEIHNYDLPSLGKKPLFLPSQEVIHPHPDALSWHRTNVWRH